MYSLIANVCCRIGLCIALIWAFAPSAALAQGSPFTCDVVFYQIRNGSGGNSITVKFATVSGTVTPTAVYTTTQPTTINAVGYNPVDNYMYGISTAGPQLYRMGQAGFQLVGTISGAAGGLSLTGFTPTAGVFDAAGRFYFAGQGGTPNNITPAAIFRIDSIPTTGAMTVAHQYNLSPTAQPNPGDFDFNGAGGPNGLLMAANGTVAYRYQLTQGGTPITGTAAVTTATIASVGSTGSAFYDAFAGRFYTFDNGAGTFYEIINPDFGVQSSVATVAPPYSGPPTQSGTVNSSDGTSCPISGTRRADVQIFKTDNVTGSVPNGAVISYTITVVNKGPYPANYSKVYDPPAPGLTKLSATCAAPTGPPTAVCPATLSVASLESGVQVLTFPPDSTLVFTVNAKVSATVSVQNTATVSVAVDTVDGTLSNNVAVATTLISGTNSVVTSAASQCPAGTVEGFTNFVANPNFNAGFTSGYTTAATNTLTTANSVSQQSGSRTYVLGTAQVQQYPFPGDSTARSVPGTNNWLLANGKVAAGAASVWSETVNGLTVGRIYEFMVYMSNASNPGAASTPLPNMQLRVNGTALTGATFAPAAIEATGQDTWSLVQGTFTATATSMPVAVFDVGGASPDPSTGNLVALAQPTVRQCSNAADVQVTKTNGVNSVVSLANTAYTVTVANLSASVNATQTQIVDPPASGMIKGAITCTAGTGSTCPPAASVTVANFESGLIIPLIASSSSVTFLVNATVTAAPGSTVSNVVTVAGVGYTDSNPANNQASDTDAVTGQANLSLTKSDTPTTSVTAGGSTSYLIKVSNAGPADVVGALLKDPQAAGLSCTAVSCSGVIGPTTCPAPADVTVSLLQSSGIVLPRMQPLSSITFQVDCGITGTGF